MIWTGGAGNAQRILVETHVSHSCSAKTFRQLTAGLTSALVGSENAFEVMIEPANYCDAWALMGHGYPD